MINKIMESVYTREYMFKHSYTGRKAPKPKEKENDSFVKERLPEEDVTAIHCKFTNNLTLY